MTRSDLTRDEFEALGTEPEPTMSRDEFEALGTEPAAATDLGGLAGTSSTPEQDVDWGGVNSLLESPELDRIAGMSPGEYLRDLASPERAQRVQENAGWALPLAAAVTSGGLSAIEQGAVNVGSGMYGRYKAGEDPLSFGGITKDILTPVGVNLAIGGAKGIASPMMRKLYGNLDQAIEDIRDWAKLPKVVESPNTVARPLEDAAETIPRYAREAVSGPVSVGKASRVPELRETAHRLDLFPRARNRIAGFVQRARDDIFRQPAGGLRGMLGMREEIPATAREQIKLLMEGHLRPDQVTLDVVERAGKLRRFYDTMGDLGDQFDIFGDAPRMQGYSGPNVLRIQPGTQGMSSAEELSSVARGGERTTKFRPRNDIWNPLTYESDALKIFDAYGRDVPDIYGAAYAFGPDIRGGVSEGTHAFGTAANELLNRAASRPLKGKDRFAYDLLRDSLQQIYQYAPQKGDRAIGAIEQGITTPLLAYSGIRQLGQNAWNISRYGLQNTAEGLVRYLKDPEFRALMRSSGASASPMERVFNELRPGRPSVNPVGKTVGFFEHLLREPLSAGAIPYYEDVASSVAKGQGSAALSKQIEEMGVNPALVAQGNASTLRDSISGLVGRTQLLSPEPGQSSSALTQSMLARIVGRFRPYGLGTTRLSRDDIWKPIGQGAMSALRGGDASLLGLGANRLARLIPASIAMESLVAAGTGAQRGAPTDIDPYDIGKRVVRQTGGIVGDVAVDVAPGMLSMDPSEVATGLLRSVSPPAATALTQRDKATALGAGLTLLHPTVGGTYSLLLPALRELLKEE